MKLPTPLNTFGGNPRSDDRMLAAIMCRNPLGGGILGGALGFAGPADDIFGGAVLHPTHSWRRISTAWRSANSEFDVRDGLA